VITRALIEERGGRRMEPEMRDLLQEFAARGVPAETFTIKKLQRRQLPLAPDTLVASSVPAVLGALKQMGVGAPEPDDYPECLSHLLQRRVWRARLGAVVEGAYSGLAAPVFVKPADRLKRFTGAVIGGPKDLWRLEGASRSLPVFCADVVSWRSEWRAFVVRGEVVGLRPYSGELTVPVDAGVVREAVGLLQRSGRARAGYAADFGVLVDTGETALVEVNDGFALGSYGLDRAAYADLTVARWQEMVKGGRAQGATTAAEGGDDT
jgi:hypothetical protein